MNRRTISEAIVFMFLVGVGVMARVLLRDIPNFAPVAALALFAGYMFRHQLVACAVPLLVMLVSDLIIDAGGYPLPLMLAVYGLLAFPVCLRGPLRRFLSLESDNPRTRRLWTRFGGLIGCSLACSLLFFVGTNWMVWMTSSWYEPTLGGLAQCLAQAIPFFRYTLAGDAVFATVFFGSYVAVFHAVQREVPVEDQAVYCN